jgi:hypothetical protein
LPVILVGSVLWIQREMVGIVAISTWQSLSNLTIRRFGRNSYQDEMDEEDMEDHEYDQSSNNNNINSRYSSSRNSPPPPPANKNNNVFGTIRVPSKSGSSQEISYSTPKSPKKQTNSNNNYFNTNSRNNNDNRRINWKAYSQIRKQNKFDELALKFDAWKKKLGW